jgi:hypothetical protein
LRKINPLEVFGSVETPKRHFLSRDRRTESFDVKIVKIGRAVFAGRGDTKRTKSKKKAKKLTETFVGGADLIG